MSGDPAFVLDSSALLAYVLDEPGADFIEQTLAGGFAISAVNWAEVLSKLADHGKDPDAEAARLLQDSGLAQVLQVFPLTELLAREIAWLRRRTKGAGLSIGDRACLALARHLGVPALTTDRVWSRLQVPIRVQAIR